jgi:hypothetical protein
MSTVSSLSINSMKQFVEVVLLPLLLGRSVETTLIGGWSMGSVGALHTATRLEESCANTCKLFFLDPMPVPPLVPAVVPCQASESKLAAEYEEATRAAAKSAERIVNALEVVSFSLPSQVLNFYCPVDAT